MTKLTTYIRLFSTLHVKIVNGKKYPNKAIMLVSIMELIRCGYICINRIEMNETLKYAFNSNWELYVGGPPPTLWTPFWHMKNESFWHFEPIYNPSDIENLVAPGQTASYGMMKRVIKYAYLDEALFEFLCTTYGRSILLDTLKQTYFCNYE